MKAIILPFACFLVAGCGTFQDTPKSCMPPSDNGPADMLPQIKVDSAPPHARTFLRLEGGKYTYPITSIETVDHFRLNLKSAAARKSNLKPLNIDALAKATNIENVDKNKAEYADLISEAMLATDVTGIGVTTTLISIEQMLDDLLNRADSMISSQLFALRSHVAATVSDINVVMKDRMQDAYDKLNEQQRQILDRAMVLATEAQESLDKLAKEGAFAASDLLCQTTVNFANYPNTIIGLGLPFDRCFATDILCLSSIEVRDVGTPQAEQMLQFRGVNLLPNGEYADATLLVSGKEIKLPTAGGKSILQLPLPGGLNGKAGDTSLRGPLMARVDFNWPKSQTSRSFELKPFSVRTVDVSLSFVIEGPLRSVREQLCHVYAEGGSAGSREEYATCTIVPDSVDKSIERCEEGPVTSENGDAGIRNRLFTVGACQWELRAKSKAWWGAGAWYDFIGRAHQLGTERVQGPSFIADKVINQNEKTWVIEYPDSLVPNGYKIISGQYSYNVTISDNEGNTITLTEAKPSDPKFGSAVVIGKRLTINLR